MVRGECKKMCKQVSKHVGAVQIVSREGGEGPAAFQPPHDVIFAHSLIYLRSPINLYAAAREGIK